LGTTITEGLGAGADPEVGEKSAIESIEDIKASMGQNTKMVLSLPEWVVVLVRCCSCYC
jgi:cell division GTPase FtsZ